MAAKPKAGSSRRWVWMVLAIVVLVVGAGVAAVVLRGPSADRYLTDGKRQLETGDLRAAIISLKNAVKAAPDNASARALLAEASLAAGDAASAEKEARQARVLGLDDARTIDLLGQSLLLLNKTDAILQEIAPGNRGPSTEAAVHIWRGYALLAKRDRDQARAAFARALELEPKNPRGFIGQARLAIEQRRADEAEAAVDKALEVAPRNGEALALKGELQRQSGRREEAARSFSAALESEPRNAVALLGRAVLNIDQNKLDDADKDIQILLRNYPSNPVGSYLFALASVRRGNLRPAVEQLERLGGGISAYPPALYLLGALQHRLGQSAQAEANLEKYLAIAPADVRGRQLMADLLIRRNANQKAIDLLRPLADQGLEDAPTFSLLAAANLRERNFTEADKWLDRAAKVPNQPSERHLQLAYGRLQLGQSDEALREIESAIEQDPNSVQARVALALAQLRGGEIDKAIATAKDLLVRFPDNPIPNNVLGAIYLAANNLKEARSAFEAALKVNAGFVPAALNLARLDQREGNAAGAERRYKEVIAKDANAIEAYMGLAQLTSQRGATAEAIDWLEKARGVDPRALRPATGLVDLYLRDGKADRALQVARDLQGRMPGNAQALDLLARTQLNAGEGVSAVQTFRQVVALTPRDPNAHYRLGKALQAQRDQPNALAAFRQALAVDAGHLASMIELVQAEIAAGRRDAGVRMALDWSAARPTNPGGKALVGDAYLQAGQPREALKAYEEAQKLTATPGVQLAISNAHLALGDRKAATDSLDAWLKTRPDDTAVRLGLADLYLRTQQYDPAIQQYETLAKSDQRNVVVLNNLAWLYGEKGDKRAIATAEQAVKLAPQAATVIDTLGYLHVRLGDAKRGVELLRDARAKSPQSPDIGYHLAAGLAKTGDREQARAILKEVLAAAPNFGERAEAEKLLKELGG